MLTIINLPFDILCAIFELLPPVEIPGLRRTCQTFNKLLHDKLVLAPFLRGIAPPEEFDHYVKKFNNIRRGKPTGAWLLHDLDPFRADQAEASYDHQFFVYYADVGGGGNEERYDTFTESAPHTDIVVFNCTRERNQPARVRVDPRFNLRHQGYSCTLSIDNRTLVATGVSDYLRVVGVWSVHGFPEIRPLRTWTQNDCFALRCVTSNDRWIAWSDRRGRTVFLVDLKLDDSLRPIGDTAWDQNQLKSNTTEIRLDEWLSDDFKGVRDVHLSKSHLWIYSRSSEQGSRMDTFKIDADEGYLSTLDHPQRIGPKLHLVNSVTIHAWGNMLFDYVQVNEDDLLVAQEQRLDKISPNYTGRMKDGASEEEDEAVLLTLSRAIEGQGCLPLGSVRVSVRDSNLKAPDCLIPAYVSLSKRDFEKAKARSFYVPKEGEDDKNAEYTAFPEMPDPYREWDVVHNPNPVRCMRASLPIRHRGLSTAVFHDEKSPDGIELRQDNNLPLPTMLTQTNLVRTTITDIIKLPIRHFHSRPVWYGATDEDDAAVEGDAMLSERFAELKEYRSKAFIVTGLGYSSYVWQGGNDWFGFLCLGMKKEGTEDNRYERKTFLNSSRVKMLILRYD